MLRRAVRRNRPLVLAGAAVFLLFIYIQSSWSFFSTPLESVVLQRLMNDGVKPLSGPGTKSSFDWSSVKHRNPPGDIRPLPSGKALRLPSVQAKFGAESTAERKVREAMRQEVRELFKKNWESYRRFAWQKDALLPLSGGAKEQFSGWAATLVDSLDTLWIMGLREEFDEAVDAVSRIDFGKSTNARVNIFETNIRYLGGLMSAYDLSGREVLLQKAMELGDLIYLGFNTDTRMPVDFIDFNAAMAGEELTIEVSVVSASPGTLSMEMTRLSQLTGDPKYYDAASRVMDVFHRGQNKTMLPGMWPMFVSMFSQDVTTGNKFTIAGCADSLYEYLPKMHAPLNGRDPAYEEMSRSFMEAADRALFFRPMIPRGFGEGGKTPEILISGNADVDAEGKLTLDPESEHLACFIGGLYALGGQLFSRPDWVGTGAQLTRGCVYAYDAMPTGMMPERYNMVSCPPDVNGRRPDAPCAWDEELWLRGRQSRPEWMPHLPRGFTTAKDPRYILRPEAIESVFVLWRVTGDEEWREAAWRMFEAISKGTQTEYANAAVLDVTIGEYPLRQEDYMEVSISEMFRGAWQRTCEV